MALEEQMEMSFGEVPDNTVGIDPVSGNEIPLGSSAKEVRDDIPAQLSEGEMVIPADVVRLFGVKFFEDIRQAAKIGYAKMDADGRIGGEPIMEDESGLGLEMADLEVMDDEEPVEMRRGGMSMKDYQTSAAKKSFSQAAKRNPGRTGRKTHEQIMAQFRDDDNSSSSSSSKPTDFAQGIRDRVQARKGQPKTRAEALLKSLQDYFKSNEERKNRRVKLYEKPPTSDDAPISLAEQINFGNNFADDEETKKERPRKKAGEVDKAYTVKDLREGQDPFLTRLFTNLGFDEGGMAAQELSLPTPVYDDPDIVQEGTTGGFGEEIGLDSGVFEGVMEAREYQNAAGHKIIIMFLDGEPIQDIPAGYYPVGSEPVPVEPGEQTSGGGGSDDDDDGGSDMPKPFNYKELTIDELTKEVKNLRTPTPFGPGILGTAVGFLQKRHEEKTIEEINRRLESTDIPIYEREYLENLKEVAEAPKEKGPIGKFIDKITGEEVEEPDLPKLDTYEYDMLPNQYGIIEAYTPETKTADTPEAGLSPEIMKQVDKISADAAAKAFSGYKAPGTEKDDDDDDDKGPTIKPTKPTYTQPGSDPYAEPGRPTSSNNDDDDGPAFRPPTPDPKPSPIYDDEAAGDYDDDSTGVHKGALMNKPKVKKVVKGLKKASKLHAKQAKTLEEEVKKK